jgi:hypothetical protein
MDRTSGQPGHLSLFRNVSLKIRHWAQVEGPQVIYICIKMLKIPPLHSADNSLCVQLPQIRLQPSRLRLEHSAFCDITEMHCNADI